MKINSCFTQFCK